MSPAHYLLSQAGHIIKAAGQPKWVLGCLGQSFDRGQINGTVWDSGGCVAGIREKKWKINYTYIVYITLKANHTNKN
ncbi:hypothetical protein XELAEV_18019045mg [Xenopus laevis]|uniref:Uncharacterized protein n=1 Tax=Xenopus laevis TaxID=8355 RepID=A0A974DFC1_XENLA|nr:hypothetical protein XELAEV_18019045mg [Xenopus laevis]